MLEIVALYGALGSEMLTYTVGQGRVTRIEFAVEKDTGKRDPWNERFYVFYEDGEDRGTVAVNAELVFAIKYKGA